MSLFRTKPIDVNADTGLKRCLGAFDLTMLGIGCIIGTGIFVLTGVVAAQHSGPAIVLSFILSGTACAFAALSYADLARALRGAVPRHLPRGLRLGRLLRQDPGSARRALAACADERPARRWHRQCARHGHRAA